MRVLEKLWDACQEKNATLREKALEIVKVILDRVVTSDQQMYTLTRLGGVELLEKMLAKCIHYYYF
jgi:hypothetical protein